MRVHSKSAYRDLSSLVLTLEAGGELAQLMQAWVLWMSTPFARAEDPGHRRHTLLNVENIVPLDLRQRNVETVESVC